MKIQLQHELYGELCSYLTRQNYFSHPKDRKPLVNGLTFFSLALLIGIGLVMLNFIRRFSHRYSSFDDDDSNNHLSEETISSATALLSTSPANGIIHSSSKTSTIRHRVRFQSFDDSSTTGDN